MTVLISQLLLLICCIFSPSLLLAEADIRICLTMLVKNDEAVIQRCLYSTQDVIDCACICDLGSTDKTLLIIEEFMKECDIPYAIYTQDWVDFGHNRTLSVQAAQKTLQECDFPLKNSYLLILDPEMQLKSSSFLKTDLKDDAYLIWEESLPLSYCRYNMHLLRASLPWLSIGAANEYWLCREPYRIAQLSTLKIEESEELLFTKARLETKAELLSRALQKEPSNARYLFYLAQVYASLNKDKEAVESFEAYIKVEPRGDEVWFCKFMIGHCYEKIGEWDKALYWYLEAYQSNPDQAEPLQKIVTYYRLRGENDIAYIFAKHGSRIPTPDHLSSILPPLLSYQFDEELSIVAYYTRFQEDGQFAVNQLILRKDTPWWAKDQAYRNLLYYIHPLPDAQYKPIRIALPFIQEGFEERYHPMNPSIQKTEMGYKVICRAVNYTQIGAKEFNTIDKTGIFRTKNFLVEFDRDLHFLSQVEIVENLPRERIRSFNLEGLDDCRIFEFQNHSWFTCTTNDTNPTGTFQISLCLLADQQTETTLPVKKLIPLQGPDPFRCEKNWLPFVKDGLFHVIYSYEPLMIYRVNPDTGHCEMTHQEFSPLDFSRFRGSAAPIPFDQGYLLIVHEVVYFYDFQRAYLHRFLYLDEHFAVKRLSDPFFFQHQGVEFCCGMVADHAEEELIITIGVEDREAFFCLVPLHTVRSLLRTLETFIPAI
jgi:tetratricopeptide (TPR) repeat protein